MIGTQLALRPFALSDRPKFTAISKKNPHTASEPSFANVWVWGHYPVFGEVDGHLLVRYDREEGDENRFLPPIGPDPCRMMRRMILEHGMVFDRVGLEFAAQLQGDDRIHFEKLPGDADYCYRPSELRACFEPNNPQFEHLRGHLRRVRRLNPEVVRITPDRLDDCRTVNRVWLESKGDGLSQDHIDDAEAAGMMLDHFTELELFGILVYIAGRPEAFMLGDISAKGSAVLHFAKANKAVRGLSDFAFYSWSTDAVPPDCTEVNFMQDCGVESLGRFKRSLGPSHFVEKARLSAR